MAGCRRGDTGAVAERLPVIPGSAHLGAMPRRSLMVALALALTAALALGSAAAVTDRKSSVLTASNWTLLLQGEWMVQFFAPWCSACQQIQAEWEKFAHSSVAMDITVGKVDVTQEPGLSGRFFVTTLPTIFHAKDGVFRKYRGPRTSEELQSYIMLEKWEGVEPITGWKSPSSITMYGMAGLFHLSGWIREAKSSGYPDWWDDLPIGWDKESTGTDQIFWQIHSYFTGPLGIPVWGSYIIFIISILLIGLVLGLILVLLADCICPPKPRYRVERSEEVNEKENVDVSDEEHEEEEGTLDEKKDQSDVEDEENNGSDRASGEESNADEGGSEAGEQEEDKTEQHLADPEAESDVSVRQRKVPVTENEQ